MSHRYFNSYVPSSGWNSYYRSHISHRGRWRRGWRRRRWYGYYNRRSWCSTSSSSEC